MAKRRRSKSCKVIRVRGQGSRCQCRGKFRKMSACSGRRRRRRR